jgi:long-subunit fatty acid transport protein
MNTFKSSVAALLLTTTAATAGGIDRTGNPYAVLFEEGNHVQLSFSSVTPDVTGAYPAAFGGGSTGNMAEAYASAGAALKFGLTDSIDVGLFINQPYGANALYPDGAYTGLGADWESNQVALVLKYQATSNISVYGGARSIESSATIAIPDALIRGGLAAAAANPATPAAVAANAAALARGAPAGTLAYTATANADRQTSYIAGVAYERPDIALRVALTYESGYTHAFATTEAIAAVPSVSGDTTTEIEIPQSVTLDFQSGIAADTLLFGSVRWSEWSVWEVRPAGYAALTSGDRVTGLDNDVFTYRVGVGRKINDSLSVFGRVTHETSNGGEASRLAPTDGSTAFGIGGTYTMENIKLTGGIEYVTFGEATDASGTIFADNTALGFGLSVGYSF